jgi:hypothetical protein
VFFDGLFAFFCFLEGVGGAFFLNVYLFLQLSFYLSIISVIAQKCIISIGLTLASFLLVHTP